MFTSVELKGNQLSKIGGRDIQKVLSECPSYLKWERIQLLTDRLFEEEHNKTHKICFDRSRDWAIRYMLVLKPLGMLRYSAFEELRVDLQERHGLDLYGGHQPNLKTDFVLDFERLYRVDANMEHPTLGKYFLISPIYEPHSKTVAYSTENSVFVINSRRPDYFDVEKYSTAAEKLGLIFPEGYIRHEFNHIEFNSALMPAWMTLTLLPISTETKENMDELFSQTSEVYAYLGNASHRLEEVALRAVSFLEMRDPGYTHRTALERMFKFLGTDLGTLGNLKSTNDVIRAVDKLVGGLRSEELVGKLKATFGFSAMDRETKANAVENLVQYQNLINIDLAKKFIEETMGYMEEVKADIIQTLDNNRSSLARAINIIQNSE